VQHWPILIIFGVQHQEKTRRKRLYFWLPHFYTVATINLWNAGRWACCLQVVSTYAACIHSGGGHFEHML